MMLTPRGVVAGYGGGDVLQGFITVERGSVACIVGAQRGGRVTILRTVSGCCHRVGKITLKGGPSNLFGHRDSAPRLAGAAVQRVV